MKKIKIILTLLFIITIAGCGVRPIEESTMASVDKAQQSLDSIKVAAQNSILDEVSEDTTKEIEKENKITEQEVLLTFNKPVAVSSSVILKQDNNLLLWATKCSVCQNIEIQEKIDIGDGMGVEKSFTCSVCHKKQQAIIDVYPNTIAAKISSK